MTSKEMTLEIKNAKQFAERLNASLDESEAPAQIRERSIVLSKMVDIPRQQAWSLLEGHILPSLDLLMRIAEEFEVDAHWLSGQDA